MTNLTFENLNSICIVKGGKRLPKGQFLTEEITDFPYLRVRDFKNFTINKNDLLFLKQETQNKIRNYIVKEKDVLLSIAGTIGRLAIVNKNLDGANLTENAAKITLRKNRNKEYLSEYILIYLNSRFGKGQIKNLSSFTSQPKLSLDMIRDIKISKINIDEQTALINRFNLIQKLIDLNNDKIKNLYSISNLIYKEWFLNKNFNNEPDIKKYNFNNNSWTKIKLKKIFNLNYGKALTEDNRKDGSVPVYGSSGIIGYHDKPLINGKGIILGRKGNVGSVHWTFDPYCPIDTVYYVEPNKSNFYNYFLLKNLNLFNTDSSVPGLNRDYVHDLEINLPPIEVINYFNIKIENIFREIFLTDKNNKTLYYLIDLILDKFVNE